MILKAGLSWLSTWEIPTSKLQWKYITTTAFSRTTMPLSKPRILWSNEIYFLRGKFDYLLVYTILIWTGGFLNLCSVGQLERMCFMIDAGLSFKLQYKIQQVGDSLTLTLSYHTYKQLTLIHNFFQICIEFSFVNSLNSKGVYKACYQFSLGHEMLCSFVI